MNLYRRALAVLRSNTGRLTLTYLTIIMIMSIGFSAILYSTSAREFDRQVPEEHGNPGFGQSSEYFDSGQPPPNVRRFLNDRADQARSSLIDDLVLLNIVTLVVGGIISYSLARRALEPIEAAMLAQTRFVSDASHELRTPLAAIQTSNEVALRKPKLTLPQAKKIIGQNTEDVRRLSELSDSLLSLAAQDKQGLKLVSTSLQDIAGDALNQIIPVASIKEIAVEDTVPAIRVAADHTSLTRALVILLDNAIKYSPEKSTVKLTATRRGKNAELKVIDQGMGIAASDVPHLFRRFYRADTARTTSGQYGYGLGLSIADNIIRQHNGHILVESVPKHGSTFTVVLPIN